MNIVEIIPKEDHLLYIKTEDGQAGLFDVTPYLESEAFAPLKDKSEFDRVHNGRYFIEWDCGADLSADTIQARWKPTTIGTETIKGSPLNDVDQIELVIYWSEEDQSFVVEVPELPECMADGATYEQAVANSQKVIEEWIETAQELNRPIPEPRGRLMYA